MESIQTKKSLIRIGLFILLVVLLIGGGSFFFYQRQHQQKAVNTALPSPSPSVLSETEALIAKVAALVNVPQDETPKVATITDKDRLKDAFFANAKNGDKMLIYSKAQKAYLYDPVANKVLDIAPIRMPIESSASAKPKASAELALQKSTVALYNGTDTVGMTVRVADSLTKQFGGWVSIGKRTDAATSNYQKTLIIDLTPNHAAEAKQLAQFLNATIEQLPQGEAKPTADLLIIIGKDQVAQ